VEWHARPRNGLLRGLLFDVRSLFQAFLWSVAIIMKTRDGIQFDSVPRDPRPLIDHYFEVFTDFAGRARRCMERGEQEECAGYVQLAAQYAWFHPTGELASHKLEALLSEISKNLNDAEVPGPVRTQSSPKRILHVVTEMYKVGGHTRLIWRWIRADAQRSHSVVLTRQMEGEVPGPLLSAVHDACGQVHYLDRSPGGILARARALRRIAKDFDHVVIHAHPWDVVPLIAFLRAANLPPITHMNKDDHVFFLGATTANQVAQMRQAGSKLCQDRRGIPASRCKLLPIPLDTSLTRGTRDEAKRALGISEETVVLFSVATAYKYATSAMHFAEVLLPVVQAHPNTLLLVIGPGDQGEWAKARIRSGGRIRALGKLSKVNLYYQAADVYLDSFPIASLTSSLEGGSYGTAVASYWCHSPDAEVLSAEDPALTNVMFRGRSLEEYRGMVSRLVRDPQLRAEAGNLTRDRIALFHSGEGWLHFLEELYANVPAGQITDSVLEVRRGITELDLELARTYLVSGLSSDVRNVVSDHVGMFPLKARAEFWVNELRFAPRSIPTCLLSDGLKTRLRLLCSQLAAD